MAAFGPGAAAVITTANRGEIIASPGSSWRTLPLLPPGTATLAPGPGGAADALAVTRGTLTISLGPRTRRGSLDPDPGHQVPIQYGSSS
jgi:hypothetical protein